MLTDFHFLRPLWLWLLLPLLVLAWRLLRAQGDADVWDRLVDPHLLPRLLVDSGGQVQRLPVGLLGLGWLLLTLALAGPTWERLPQPLYQPQEFRVIVLDISPTMNATDVPPSRLNHARFEVLDLLHKAQEGQTALIAYGAEPFVVSPLTADVATIAAQVPSLETSLLPVQGPKRTDRALAQAGELLTQAGAPDGEVILVTDGLDHRAAAIEATRKLARKGYQVSVLGVGTAKGAPVPTGGEGFLKDQHGAIRVVKLDSAALKTLAAAGGGTYVTAGVGDRDIDALLPMGQATHLEAATKQADTKTDQWREEGPWLLLLLLPLAALAFRRGWLSPLLVVVVLLPPSGHASTWDNLWTRPEQQAIKKFRAGDAAQAAALFERPDWRAAAQYRAGNYDQALQALAGQAGPQVAYNQGNTLARLGRLKDAVAAYDRALAANPDDTDARHNRELVQRLLDQRQAQQDKRNQQGPSKGQDQRDQTGQQGQSQGQQGQRQQAQQGEQGQQQGSQGQHNGQNAQGQQAGSTASQQQRSAAADEQQQKTPRNGQIGTGQQAKGEPQISANQTAQASQSPPKQAQDASARADASNSHQPKTASGEEKAHAQKPDNRAKADAEASRSSRQSAQAVDKGSSAQQGNAPGLADLLGGDQATQGRPADVQTARVDREDSQAMEQMLRRVEDDPAGLLRQRFLLQYLRRHGRLP